MLDAALWGLIQGLTEFLPISSSGHLVIIPALLGREGPDLATSALLHVGTLVAVLIYFREELMEIARLTDKGKRLFRFIIIGTIPAAVLGLALRSTFDRLNEQPRLVAVALIFTGILLLASRVLQRGERNQEQTTTRDAVMMGFGQALALIPGISRSGTTIAAGLLEGFERREAAALAFLLGIPAIGGAGLLNIIDLMGDSGAGISSDLLVGMVVAAVVGYAAIALLLRLIERTGLAPFGWYCIALGVVGIIVV